ncbi:MAG: hypothetical protein V2G42_03420 [bacterium JZ-2024 1]
MRGKGVANSILVLLSLALCAPFLGSPEGKALNRLLASIGMNQAELGILPTEADFVGGGKYRLHYFNFLWQKPLAMPDILGPFSEILQERQNSAGWLAMQSIYPLGIAPRRNLIGSPADEWKGRAGQANALSDALYEVFVATGGKFRKGDLRNAQRALSSVPDELRVPVATLLLGIADSLRWRNYALRDLSPADRERLSQSLLTYISSDNESDPREMRWVESMLDRVDFADLYVGAVDLALAVDAFFETASKADLFPVSPIRVDTPAGAIVIGGRSDDDYRAETRWLLILDPAGNDQYTGAGFAWGDNRPLSLVIDLGGNDTYGADDRKGPNSGGALLGYAIIRDQTGDDFYNAGTLGGASAAIGFALIQDFAGNDRYKAYILAEGAGHFGVGILADLAGDDGYYLYQKGQGYGFTLGSGVLFDAAGNDRYIAEDKDIRFPSPQTKEHNVSLAQGAGYGKRADYTDQHSLSGGIGLLVDLSGDDAYSCGVFGQGVGYWYGVGGLVDLAGTDSYEGIWYVQAASAHFAVGVLWEGGGNDHYAASMNMAQGAGHDFSVGYLLDEAGDDNHSAPNLSLGGGNANGIGIFWDRAGNDIYATKPGLVLGRSSVAAQKSIRERMRTLGIFLDSGDGNDTYLIVTTEKVGETSREVRVPHPVATNNAIWQQPGANNNPLEIGAGIDE